jgi:ribonucleoside-diphosphate reductase subunit M2
LQAASSLEQLKMGDSPVKPLNFAPADKENDPAVVDASATELSKPVMDNKPTETAVATKVAASIKETEAHEPLLQENPHRFVLFPIKYHEVSYKTSTRRA